MKKTSALSKEHSTTDLGSNTATKVQLSRWAKAHSAMLDMAIPRGTVNGVTMAGWLGDIDFILDKVNGVAIMGFGNNSLDVNGVASSLIGVEVKGKANGAIFGLFSNGEPKSRVGGVGSATLNGLAIAGLFNQLSFVNGVEVAGLINTSDKFTGLSLAGFCSIIKQSLVGVSISVINYSSEFTGCMIGLFNVSTKASVGVKLGLLNINWDAPWYRIFTPGISIHIAGLKKRKELLRIMDEITRSEIVISIRNINRSLLANHHCWTDEVVISDIVTATFGAYGKGRITSSLSEDDMREVKLFIKSGKLNSFFRILNLGSKLSKSEIERERVIAARELVLIASDQEIYGSWASKQALKELLHALSLDNGNIEAYSALTAIGVTGISSE
ncbi:MAG: hypothetical protein ABII39_01440 [Candidatus Micrarchaeota archaeon]